MAGFPGCWRVAGRQCGHDRFCRTAFRTPATDRGSTDPARALLRIRAAAAGGHAMIRRIFPHPYLSALLILIWMLLVNRFAWGSLVFATILSIAIPAL